MPDRRVTTKAALLEDMERAWGALNAFLDRLSSAQLTTLRDAQGWAVKDHLIHLLAWERSVAFFLQGQPRHEGLGVDKATYLSGNDDTINAVIHQQHQALPINLVLTQFRQTHQHLLTLLQPLNDDDLNQRYRHYLADEPRDGDGPPAINVIYGNTAHHIAEHLGWMEKLVNSAG